MCATLQAHRAAVSSSGFAAALVVVSSGLSAALAALAALQARGTVARAATAASSHRDNNARSSGVAGVPPRTPSAGVHIDVSDVMRYSYMLNC